MADSPVRDRIEELVEEEERLWRDAGQGGLSADGHRRLEEVRADLDHCWVTLRRRRAGTPDVKDRDVPDPPNELEGPDAEPPHLERGSPHADEPGPEPDEPRDVP